MLTKYNYSPTRLFDSNFNRLFKNIWEMDAWPFQNDTVFAANDDGSLSLYVDLPGVQQQDLNVEVVNDTISIKAERKNKGSTYNYTKAFNIPKYLDASTLTADLSDGVLTLSMQKIEQTATPKQIEVKTKYNK